jgi:hypothetical protein
LICDDGVWKVIKNERPSNETNDVNKYYLKECELEGYRCNTSTYDLTVSYIESTMKDTPLSSGREGKDRKEVKGKRGQYKICIDYNSDGRMPPNKTVN